ncbi:reverse transcriptase domain-containing protein [Tanacetum coccineum]
MVPRAVLMKSGLVSVNIARQVNAAHSKTTVNAARPKSHFSKLAHSTVKRPIHKNTTFKNSNFNQRVNTVKDKNVNTVRPKAVVNAARPKAVVNVVKGNNINAVKASDCWIQVSNGLGPQKKLIFLSNVQGNPQMDLQDKGVIDSGCSRHMTWNMSYFTDYEEIDGGYVAFGGNPKRGKITRKSRTRAYSVLSLKFASMAIIVQMEELTLGTQEGYGEAIVPYGSKLMGYWKVLVKTDDRIDKLRDQISTLVEIVSKKVVTPATVKVVEESCVICGDAHAYYNYVFVKVGKFHFPTDFVVVDFDTDPRVSLILGRSFLRTSRALIGVYGEVITLRVNDEAITFNLNQTTRYSSTYDDMSVNRIDVIDIACEEYAQEVLGFSNKSMGGNPILSFKPIISESSPSFTCLREVTSF